MPFATSLFEHGTVVGPSAVTCSNAASRSAGRIGAVQCLLLAEVQMRVVGQCLRQFYRHKCVHAVGVAAAAALGSALSSVLQPLALRPLAACLTYNVGL